MSKALLATESGCAIFEESFVGDDTLYNNPLANLAGVYFHSEFDYYGLLYAGAITINHPVIGGVAGNQYSPPNISIGPASITVNVEGQRVEAGYVLYQHGLGYVPRFFVAYNGQMIPHGLPVQAEDGSRMRFVSAYATDTFIGLKEMAFSSASDLPAVQRTYQFLVFREPSTGLSGDQLLIEAGNVWFGRGKFRSSEPHLRLVGAGDTPYGIARGPTAGYGNGGIRAISPNGTITDFGPFSGSFAAPSVISVGV